MRESDVVRLRPCRPGTGKSHLAVALGLEAIKRGKSVYFTTLAELVNSLAKAEREGQLRERIRFYTRNAQLIIDAIGMLQEPKVDKDARSNHLRFALTVTARP